MIIGMVCWPKKMAIVGQKKQHVEGLVILLAIFFHQQVQPIIQLLAGTKFEELSRTRHTTVRASAASHQEL